MAGINYTQYIFSDAFIGNGKTHYIRRQTEATQRVTIPVNESFSVHSTIKKLQKLHDHNVCVVHFNFTSVPPGVS